MRAAQQLVPARRVLVGATLTTMLVPRGARAGERKKIPQSAVSLEFPLDWTFAEQEEGDKQQLLATSEDGILRAYAEHMVVKKAPPDFVPPIHAPRPEALTKIADRKFEPKAHRTERHNGFFCIYQQGKGTLNGAKVAFAFWYLVEIKTKVGATLVAWTTPRAFASKNLIVDGIVATVSA